MPKNIIFYNSLNFPEQPLIKFKTISMSKVSKTNPTVIKELLVKPKQVILYDHEEIIQLDIYFDTEIEEGVKEFNTAYCNFDMTEITQLYPDKWFWTVIELIPNEYFKNNFIELDSINNLIKISQPNTSIISICCPVKEVSLKIGNEPASGLTYRDLNKIVQFETLTSEESIFVSEKTEKINQLVYNDTPTKKGFSLSNFSNLFGNKKNTESSISSTALINSLHLTEQEKQIFDPDMLTVSIGASDSELALAKLTGLENVKTEIKKLKSKLQYRKRQRDRGIYIEDSSSMHMCFTGSPGTGKTTVARIITGILYNMGYIKENKCIEVNGQNLKGGYQGQTAIITKLVMKSAKNKVLFIDEAYALFDGYQSGYGKEAVAVILKHMEDERDNTIVIFAGYKDDMEEFLTMNDGLKSRINRYIHFKNYSTEELTEILISSLKSKKLYISESALKKCVLAFKKAATTERFSNARFVRNLIEKIEYEHAYNTHNTSDVRRQDTIEIEDVPDEIIEELLLHSQ